MCAAVLSYQTSGTSTLISLWRMRIAKNEKYANTVWSRQQEETKGGGFQSFSVFLFRNHEKWATCKLWHSSGTPECLEKVYVNAN